MSKKIISMRFNKPGNHTLATYVANGGYRSLEKLFKVL